MLCDFQCQVRKRPATSPWFSGTLAQGETKCHELPLRLKRPHAGALMAASPRPDLPVKLSGGDRNPAQCLTTATGPTPSHSCPAVSKPVPHKTVSTRKWLLLYTTEFCGDSDKDTAEWSTSEFVKSFRWCNCE